MNPNQLADEAGRLAGNALELADHAKTLAMNVSTTMAPEVTVEAVSANANWNSQNARNATLVDPYAAVMPCRKKYW